MTRRDPDHRRPRRPDDISSAPIADESGPAETLSRRAWLASVVGLGAGSVLALPGCDTVQGLDTSARAEGTGIQIVGAIIVLAKYRASQRQKTIAEQKSRRAFVDRAMRPALAAAKKKVQTRRQTQVAEVQQKLSADPARREQALADLQRTAERELASLETSWRETAARYTGGTYTADFAVQKTGGTVAFASVKDSEVLTASAAYVPRYLAVAVPGERAVARAAASVMFWDAQSHRLASEDVYAVDREPNVGELAKFDNICAEYVER
jgi:hypothetical protein